MELIQICYLLFAQNKNMKKTGFTLFELLITISIIGILTAVAVISFSSAQKKGRDARRMQDMKSIQTAAEQYYSQNSSVYPTAANFSTQLIGVLQTWPVDPKGVGWTLYNVSAVVPNVDYCVCAGVENPVNGNSTNNQCAFAASGNFYCVKSQQ
jgi:prepilin-type N-terminal cleavage/methylation domain-containing protein